MNRIGSIAAGREHWHGGAAVPRHIHEHPYAAVILSGGYEECGSHGRFRAGPGDVLFHDAFDTHLDRFAQRGAEILNLALPAGSAPPHAFGRIADPEGIVRLAERDMPAAAARLLAESAVAPIPAGDWPDRLATALAADRIVCFADWAEAQGLAPETVSRGFARLYGASPSHYRLEARSRRALRRIQHDPAPLADIAVRTGFADQAHMTRAVRALTGATPGQWRARFRPGIDSAAGAL